VKTEIDEMVASFLAFRGDDEVAGETTVTVQVVDIHGDRIEIAYDAPIPGKPRCYLSFSLPELLKLAMPTKKVK
jgi:hypothetical protein